GRGPAADSIVRPGARVLAAVLPEPARISRYRGNRPHRRHRAPAGTRRGAAAPDRRDSSRRRSARACSRRQEDRSRRADGLARDRDRPGDRGLMKAVNLLPRAEARRSVKAGAPVITGVVAAIVVTGVLCAGFLMTSATVAKKRDALDAAQA